MIYDIAFTRGPEEYLSRRFLWVKYSMRIVGVTFLATLAFSAVYSLVHRAVHAINKK